MKKFKEFIEEAKQGHALVVGGKVVARGSKKQLLKKVKKDGIKIDHKKNFLAYTGKEVGDNWQKEMLKFKQYSEIISKISKKLKVSKDVATAVLAKAQEKGINL